IVAPAATPNTMEWGILVQNSGLGAVTVTNNGAIGAAGDRTQNAGIEVQQFNAASTAAVSVSGTGAIFSDGDGIEVVNAGTGTTTGTNATIFAASTGDGAYTITNQTGGTINGRVDLTDANDTLTNAGTLNLAGAQNFFLGTDVITNSAGGITNVAAGTAFNGL